MCGYLDEVNFSIEVIQRNAPRKKKNHSTKQQQQKKIFAIIKKLMVIICFSQINNAFYI